MLNNGMDFSFVGCNITNEIKVDGALNFLNPTAIVNEPAYWGSSSATISDRDAKNGDMRIEERAPGRSTLIVLVCL
jgi:hypothetical protein